MQSKKKKIHTHVHTSPSSSSAAVIRLLSSPVIRISCEWSGPRWQLHKGSDRCLWMRQIRERMVSLLLLLTPWTLPLFALSVHLDDLVGWKIAHIGSNEAEMSYNIKELHCLPLKVLFASQASFLYLDSSLGKQNEGETLVICFGSYDRNSPSWILLALTGILMTIIPLYSEDSLLVVLRYFDCLWHTRTIL